MEIYRFRLNDFLSVFLPLVLGAVSMLLWLGDIRYSVGWEGEAWIRANLISVYPITFISVLSYILPSILISKPKIKNVIISIAVLYLFAQLIYFVSKWVFEQLYLKIEDDSHVLYVWLLILVVTAAAAVFFYTKQILLFKSDRFHVMTIVAVFISIVPASLITIEWINGYAVAESFVESVKMGYPIFWLNVMLGWVSYAMVKKLI